jgi:hypothetical protein
MFPRGPKNNCAVPGAQGSAYSDFLHGLMRNLMTSEQAQSQRHPQPPQASEHDPGRAPSAALQRQAWETPLVTAAAVNELTAGNDDSGGGS